MRRLTQKFFPLIEKTLYMRPVKNISKEKEKKNLMLLIVLKKNKKAKKRKFQDVENKINHYLDPRRTKTIIDFNDRESASIKSFAEKKKKRDKSNN